MPIFRRTRRVLLHVVCSRTVTFTVLAPHNRYQPHPAEPAQHTTCSNTRLVLLKVGIMMPETCWESIDNKHLTVASYWFSLSLHNLLMMHGHRNLKAYFNFKFSFKFKEIKVYTLFTNWLIWEKCLSIFIINLGLWIACITQNSVNSLLLTSHNCGCCVFDHYFITTHTIHNGRWFTNLLLCDILCNKAPRTEAHATLGSLTHCALSLATRWTKMQHRGLGGGGGYL